MEENGSLSINKSCRSNDYRKTIIKNEESFGEFSWPPRSYTCSFCKREFRSAQALGGHMNVHRKEKAKLRYLPPSSHQYFSSSLVQPNPNPNPNISTSFASNSSSFTTMFPPFTYSSMSPTPFSCFLPFSNSTPCLLHRLCCCSSDGANFTTMRSEKSDLMSSGGVDDVSREQKSVIYKNSETSNLLVDSKLDDMDLELRLGCS